MIKLTLPREREALERATKDGLALAGLHQTSDYFVTPTDPSNLIPYRVTIIDEVYVHCSCKHAEFLGMDDRTDICKHTGLVLNTTVTPSLALTREEFNTYQEKGTLPDDED